MPSTSDAQLRANAKYDAANTKRYGVKLNIGKDADVILLLDTYSGKQGKQGLIKRLLREYIVARRPGVTDEMVELYAALLDDRRQRGISDD